MEKRLKEIVKNKKYTRAMSFWFVRHAQSESNALGDMCPVMHAPLTKDFSVETGTLSKFSFDTDDFDFVGRAPVIDQ